MHIIVCIKAIPRQDSLQFDPVTHNIIRTSAELVLNQPDRHALEAAVRLREASSYVKCTSEDASLTADNHISVITMGPSQASAVLRQALALGCEEAYLLSDRAFAGADTLATARVLAAAIQKLGAYDLVICGSHSLDADTGQVPVQVAEILGVPQVTSVGGEGNHGPPSGASLARSGGIALTGVDHLRITRALDCGHQEVTASLPAVLAVTEQANQPRYPHALAIMRSARKTVTTWSCADLGLSLAEVGAAGSPTQVSRLFSSDAKRSTTVYSGTIAEQTASLLRDLKMRGAL